jgi:hypothetical protein
MFDRKCLEVRVLKQENANETADSRWDAGLNAGLIVRPAAQKGKAPTYYQESGNAIRFGKAIGLAIASIVPYWTVLDTLGATKADAFQACNVDACHYVRIFGGRYMPGTGVDVISVRNGVDRPIALRYSTIRPYSCPEIGDIRPSDLSWRGTGKVCPHWRDEAAQLFLEKHGLTDDEMQNERKAANSLSLLSRYSFYLTKLALKLFAYPCNMLAYSDTAWGMERIPSGRCPSLTRNEMLKKCDSLEVKSSVYNHLSEWSSSKKVTVIGLAGWAAFTALHDVMLLCGVSEFLTLQVRWLSIVSLFFAATSIFL